MTTTPPVPLFNGLQVLGESPPLLASPFAGDAEDADNWLGNPAGTTTVGPCAGGAVAAVAVAGALTGPDTPTVTAAQAALQSLTDTDGPLIVPTGMSWNGWDAWPSCRFTTTDLVWGTIEPATAGGYQVTYRLIFRAASGPSWAGFGPGDPLPPNWPSPLGEFTGRPV